MESGCDESDEVPAAGSLSGGRVTKETTKPLFWETGRGKEIVRVSLVSVADSPLFESAQAGATQKNTKANTGNQREWHADRLIAPIAALISDQLEIIGKKGQEKNNLA